MIRKFLIVNHGKSRCCCVVSMTNCYGNQGNYHVYIGCQVISLVAITMLMFLPQRNVIGQICVSSQFLGNKYFLEFVV